jgi:hypothetical protein
MDGTGGAVVVACCPDGGFAGAVVGNRGAPAGGAVPKMEVEGVEAAGFAGGNMVACAGLAVVARFEAVLPKMEGADEKLVDGWDCAAWARDGRVPEAEFARKANGFEPSAGLAVTKCDVAVCPVWADWPGSTAGLGVALAIEGAGGWLKDENGLCPV